MLPVKANHETKYENNLTCRLCGTQEETQEHILQDCVNAENQATNNLIYKDIFSNQDNTKLKIIAQKIIETIDKIVT